MPSLSVLADQNHMEPLSDTSHNSKKKRLLSDTSSGFKESHVLGTSPRILRGSSSKMLKKKEIVPLDVIDVDKDEGSAGVVFIHDDFDTSNKGKGIYLDSDHQLKGTLTDCSFIPDLDILGSVNGVQSNFTPASNNLINLDDHCYDVSDEDDEWVEPFLDDDFMIMDDYSSLQAHFDHMDIPPDIEATIPWLPVGKNKSQSNIGTSSLYTESQIQSGSVNLQGKSTTHFKLKETLVSDLNLQAQTDGVNHPPGVNEKAATSHNKEKFSSPHDDSYMNYVLDVDAAKSLWVFDPLEPKKKQHNSNKVSINQSYAMELPDGSKPSFDTFGIVRKQVGSYHVHYSKNLMPMGLINHPPKVGPIPHFPDYAKMKTHLPLFYGSGSFFPTPGEVVNMPGVQGPIQNQASVAAGDSKCETISPKDLVEILRNFEHFKQFDTVEDHSDHHYSNSGSSLKQPTKKWTKKIQEDWKMLEKDLPDTIFVRVYESRMDLLRAVIIGAEGTPYHDGLFFFDVFFPHNYPDVPPNVYYHSGGLRLNPNLYNCGKVCLSLLNTWSGSKNEKWIPSMSTMLQVLVSIQGLILNTKPYFNEPGYASLSGSEAGESRSQRYNEDTFNLSVKTMVYNIRKPPKHFEDFVRGHFCKKAHDILVACKAYMDGAQVGSLVKGGVQDLDLSDKSCSILFKQSLSQHMSMLVGAFTQAGASDCEKFLPAPPVTVSKKRPGRASNVKIESLKGDGSKELILG